jgi:hypothetical protein
LSRPYAELVTSAIVLVIAINPSECGDFAGTPVPLLTSVAGSSAAARRMDVVVTDHPEVFGSPWWAWTLGCRWTY